MADDDDHDEDDAGRPSGRVVQLERPRSARRRGPQGRPRSVAPFDIDGTGATTLGPRGVGVGEDEAGDAPGVAPGARLRVVTVRGGRGTGETGAIAPDGEGGRSGDAGEPVLAASSSSLLHPRMRRRRIAVRRLEGRRRLRRITWILGGLAVLVDGIALAQTGFVDVDHVEVRGTMSTSAAAVRTASGIGEGDALATLDESAAEQRVETLPWVAEADVVEQWPDAVRIDVTERVPVAVVQLSDTTGGPLALVDGTGRVLDIGAQLPGGILVTGAPPSLTEGEEVPGVVRDALDVALAVNDRLPGTVTAVSTDLEATLSSGGVVRFGSLDEIDEKLAALATVLSGVDLQCLAVLNLAVADHPALTRSC